jgi:hypothetical protein
MEKTLGQQIDELQAEVDQLTLKQLEKEKAELLRKGAGQGPKKIILRKDFDQLDNAAKLAFSKEAVAGTAEIKD